MKKQKVENVGELPFTPEELALLNFSQEELEVLLDAESLRQTVDMLPEEPDAILSRLDKDVPADIEGAFNKMTELSKTDPEYVKQLVAMNEIFGDVRPEKAASVEKVDIKSERVNEGLEELKSILKA